MTARAASLGAPPRVPSRGPNLGTPPAPVEAKNNITKAPYVQFNVRLSPDRHREIRIACIKEGFSLGDYLLFLHDRYQREKGA